MNIRHILLATLTVTATLAVHGFENTFQTAIQTGDEHRGHNASDLALEEYQRALDLAGSDTERAIAYSKRAEVLAYDLQDCPRAKEEAEKALDLRKSEPVGHVTALQALAKCQMAHDRDFAAAADTIERALRLDGVDWAKPNLNLMLGDCYRETGEPRKALSAYEEVIDHERADDGMIGTAYFNIGMTQQYMMNNPARARRAYEKALEHRSFLDVEVQKHLSNMP